MKTIGTRHRIINGKLYRVDDGGGTHVVEPRQVTYYELWMGHPYAIIGFESGERIQILRSDAFDLIVRSINAKQEVWL